MANGARSGSGWLLWAYAMVLLTALLPVQQA